METIRQSKSGLYKNRRLLIETITIMGVTILLSFIFEEWKGIIILIPAIYFFIERRARKRAWVDIGFKFKDTLVDLKNNWVLVVLVAIVMQVLTLLTANYFLPNYIQHVLSRIPIKSSLHLVPVIFLLAATFMEELIFRAFFQERLSWFINSSVAIGIASFVFAVLHFSKGSLTIVIFDIGTIFIDSIIYGSIYHRTKNIFASWIPHFLADLVALSLIISVFN